MAKTREQTISECREALRGMTHELTQAAKREAETGEEQRDDFAALSKRAGMLQRRLRQLGGLSKGG